MIFLNLLAVSLSFVVAENDSTTIPLDKIWALEMPGTKNVRDLEDVPKALSKDALLRRSHVRQIEVALSHLNRPQLGEQPRTALIVQGTGSQALKEAARILSDIAEKGNKREQEWIQPLETDLSLVFYSYASGQYVRVTEVNIERNTISVKYRFVSHNSNNVTSHFALIPLGKLSKGTYPVKVIQEPRIDDKGNEAERRKDARSIVSDSFTLRIE